VQQDGSEEQDQERDQEHVSFLLPEDRATQIPAQQTEGQQHHQQHQQHHLNQNSRTSITQHERNRQAEAVEAAKVESWKKNRLQYTPPNSKQQHYDRKKHKVRRQRSMISSQLSKEQVKQEAAQRRREKQRRLDKTLQEKYSRGMGVRVAKKVEQQKRQEEAHESVMPQTLEFDRGGGLW
jgi:hypothetical protein